MIVSRIVLLLTGICTLCLLTALLIGGTLPRYELVFASTRDGDFEIYRLDVAHSLIHAITHNEINDWLPSWSPDGESIAFVSERDGNREIYTMDAVGHQTHRLTNDPTNDFDPTWSPQGTDIAYTTERFGYTEIMLVNAETGISRRLTHNDTMDMHPAWSPDGTQLLVVSDRDERWNQEIYILDVKGNEVRRLTFNPGSDVMPAWSPDGSTVLYVSTRHTAALIALDMQSGKISVLLNSLAQAFNYPNWSTDSSSIAFDQDYAFLKLLDSKCISQPDTCPASLHQLLKPDGQLYTAPRWRP